MTYYLDIDICIFVLRHNAPSLKKRLQMLSPDRLKIPAIVKAELLLGARKSGHPKQIGQTVEAFVAPFEIVSFSDACASTCANLRYDLEKRGQVIGPNDLLIAATVLANKGTLITHNTKEYGRIDSLQLEDWTS